MEKIYSFQKGLGKGVVSVLVIAGAFAAFSGFADFTIWQLLESYLKPVVGALTVGGALSMAINYVKFKTLA